MVCESRDINKYQLARRVLKLTVREEVPRVYIYMPQLKLLHLVAITIADVVKLRNFYYFNLPLRLVLDVSVPKIIPLWYEGELAGLFFIK